MDFSTFRLELSQPIHPDWQTMGDQISLENSAGEPVPKSTLVDGRKITIDPCTVETRELCGTKDDTLTPGKPIRFGFRDYPA
ncbi:hypothetical protein BKP64_12800 [Marinobacter salinus]|uniref:Uncharacterized protein n=1 Tax=Marinobacter salinus TaxID=1874317 RepID=A0A1D9GN79_9GAMM|nr:hypothetical protein [Marinobacter salinus]AOY88971.1 hypothetical protein BKP64_12800 [Marinobacter salinus]